MMPVSGQVGVGVGVGDADGDSLAELFWSGDPFEHADKPATTKIETRMRANTFTNYPPISNYVRPLLCITKR